MENIRQGGQAGFVYIHNKYAAKLVSYVRAKYKLPAATAEDAIQETLLNAFKNIHGYEQRSGLWTWLRKIADNATISLLRKEKPGKFVRLASFISAKK
ncbi:MAG: hypothetical protein GY862_00470 [Gammaproteobacteria bacterium]|nr:hypothetical protein [Gammaproteobacteria bacterium]